MPWCESCSRFWNPNTLATDGGCPSCGDVIAEAEDYRAPWHFKLMVVATVVYLGWRAVEMVGWVL